MTDLELRAEGRAFRGWTEVSVTRSIEQLAASFSLTVSELWTSRNEPVPLREGVACEIFAGGRLLLTGYVDETQISYGADDHALNAQGRSRLGDLVDCSAVVSGGDFHNQTLEQIATAICAPFGIQVISERLVRQPFRKFGLQEGESCIEAIERAAKVQGAMTISDDQGNLLIPGGITLRSTTVLERGVNILSGRRRGSWAERFGSYTVKSQNSGSSEWSGRQAAQIKAQVDDAAVTRYRPLVLVSDAQVDAAGARTRATWERNVRSGKTQRLAYTVRGWQDGDGIWTPNTTVAVKDDFFAVDDDLLLVSVVLTRGARGELAELELTRPEAFDVLATPPDKKKKDEFW